VGVRVADRYSKITVSLPYAVVGTNLPTKGGEQKFKSDEKSVVCGSPHLPLQNGIHDQEDILDG